ncbi:MAG: flagellar assembly protein FliH [Zoogloeaceae bacterium]|jgi:flagellar assembly protein FliH|nr:flagellar assembly protein FliH [Zoogloeaceae bacterium]
MADFIPKEALSSYTRWQADDFGAPSAPEEGGAVQSAPAPSTTAEGAGAAEVPSSDVPFALPTAEDIERMHEEARQSGYQAGYAEGLAAGSEEGRQSGLAAAQVYAANLQSLCQGMEAAAQLFDQEMAEAVLACALEVAGQITRRAIQVNPEILLPVIREALAALPLRHGSVTLLVAPSEIALAREHLESQFAQSGWIIQDDPELSPGGCRLRADNSEIDASLKTRWRRVLEAIGVTPEWLERQP